MKDDILTVECINNSEYESYLKIGETYEIEDKIEYIRIKDESGNISTYNMNRFKSAKKHKPKEYTFEEVILNIQEGEEYKSTKKLWIIKSIKKIDGQNRFYFDGEERYHIGNNPQQRFIKVEKSKPVNTVEAFKALDEGKIIISDCTQNNYKKDNRKLLLVVEGFGFEECESISSDELLDMWIIID